MINNDNSLLKTQGVQAKKFSLKLYIALESNLKDKTLTKNYEKRNISKAEELLEQEFGQGKITRVIPPEEKYIRRTAEDFAAGATPVRGKSHRMNNVGLSLSPELHTAAKEAAKESGVPFTTWMRAAIRKALRDGMDTEVELATEIHLSPSPNSVEAEPEPN